jgi:hypothetical protein
MPLALLFDIWLSNVLEVGTFVSPACISDWFDKVSMVLLPAFFEFWPNARACACVCLCLRVCIRFVQQGKAGEIAQVQSPFLRHNRTLQD